MEQKTFFSYSRDDAAFALKLATDLKSSGIDLWIDQLDIPLGKRWDVEVEKSLENSGSLLVILSETSVTSNNVLDEVSHALDNNKQIYPVIIDTCKIPFRLKRLQHIDFIAGYDAGLNQLLKAMKASVQPDAAFLQQAANKDDEDKHKAANDKRGVTQIEKSQRQYFHFLKKNGKLIIQILIAIIAFIIMSLTLPVFEPGSLYEDQNFSTYSKFIFAAALALCIVLCYFLSKKNIWAWSILAIIMLATGIILNINYNKCEAQMVINTGEYGYGKLVKGFDYFPEVQKIRDAYKQSNKTYPTDLDLIAGFGGNHLKVWPQTQILSNSNFIVLLYSSMLLSFTLFLIFSLQAISFLPTKKRDISTEGVIK